MKIVIALVLALLVLVVMRAAKIGLKRLATLYTGWNFRIDLFGAVEFVIWLVYIFWALGYLFRDKFYYPYLVIGIMFIVAGFISWYLLRDIIAGIVFKGKHNLKTGSYIRTFNYSGTILSQHLTYIHLRTDDGHLLRIPYSSINQDVISEDIHTEAMEEHKLRIRVDSAVNKVDAGSLIRNAILNNPYSNLKEEPSIKLLEEIDNACIFEVMLFSMNIKHIHFISMALEQNPSFKVIS